MFFEIAIASSFFTVGYFLYNYLDVLIQLYLVGVNCSKIEKTRRNGHSVYYVNTNSGKIYLNTEKMPSDIDVYYFKDKMKLENQIMSKTDFNKLYSKLPVENFTKCRDRIITSFKNSYDVNGTDYICGYMDSFFEDTVYIWKLECSKSTGYFKFDDLVAKYREEAGNFSDDDDEDQNNDTVGDEYESVNKKDL